jgi:hypothetical protein
MTSLYIHGTLQPPYCLKGMFPWKSQFLEADLQTPLRCANLHQRP